MKKHPVNKYLQHYAEPELDCLKDFPDRHYQHSLLIPAYKEAPDFLANYFLQQATTLLLVLVVNQPDDDADEVPQQALVDWLESQTTMIWSEQHLSLHTTDTAFSDVLMIKRYQADLRLPAKQGVGLARKIAADCILHLIQYGNVQSEWLASTDADAQLPTTYWENLEQHKNAGALTFGYEHLTTHEEKDEKLGQATALYEQHLKYYQAGLAWAGSPYAFHSLGSCLAIHAVTYAGVRGFPKRAGGEDFYLLNKVAKLEPVKHLPEVKVRILSRNSDRVPFGTGPAVKKILQLEQLTDYKTYHPQVFTALKEALQALHSLPITRDYDDWTTALQTEHLACLEDFGFERMFIHQRSQSLSKPALQSNLMAWFDGLLTLRFIHYLRDNYYPDIALDQALKHAPFTVNGL